MEVSTTAVNRDRTGRTDRTEVRQRAVAGGDESTDTTVMPLSGPRKYRDGQVKVYGCSPGCLLVSLAVSLGLTILLNVLIRMF